MSAGGHAGGLIAHRFLQVSTARMDPSTEGVTIHVRFVFDVLDAYRDISRTCGPAFDMARSLDPSKPDDHCPIDTYNAICDWLEQNVGRGRIRQAGVAIGKRVHRRIEEALGSPAPTPLAMMEALKWASSTMVRDPRSRGWEVLSHTEGRIVMRRTQTFNCAMQEGLLLSFLELTGVREPRVSHARCVRSGEEYCDYLVDWG
jgi:hypothetical protein